MLQRIRTIKPELFHHEGLYDLEVECGLPIRLAWIGLLTVADREGRFKWRPRGLKPLILPFDEVDFQAILEQLHKHGYILHYKSGSNEFGCIPSFKTHQFVNPKEAASVLPAPPKELLNERLPQDTEAVSTREPRVNHAKDAVPREEKRKEEKLKEVNGTEDSFALSPKATQRSDERLKALRDHINQKVLGRTCKPVRWDGVAGKQANALLASCTWGIEDLKRCVDNRFDSEGVNPSEHPSKWLKYLTDYFAAPLNRFKQPMGTGEDQRDKVRAKGTNDLVEEIMSGEFDPFVATGEAGTLAGGHSRNPLLGDGVPEADDARGAEILDDRVGPVSGESNHKRLPVDVPGVQWGSTLSKTPRRSNRNQKLD